MSRVWTICLLLTSCAAPRAYMPLTGGPLFNVSLSDQALTNASAHIAWSITVPLAGFVFDGRRGGCWASAGWIVETWISEGFFHAGPLSRGDKYYASEVRTDLATKTALPLAWLIVEAIRSHTCGSGQ